MDFTNFKITNQKNHKVEIPYELGIGVYTITNIIDGKIYVGSTGDSFYNRWLDHRNNLIKNKHPNRYLQYSVNLYGIENFKFEILEECEQELILGLEQYWINIIGVLNNEIGYNFAPIAGSTSGTIRTEEQINNFRKGIAIARENGFRSPTLNKKYSEKELNNIRQAKIKTGSIVERTIYCYSYLGHLLFKSISMKEVLEFVPVDKADILRILNKKQKQSKGFIFLYNPEEIEEAIIIAKSVIRPNYIELWENMINTSIIQTISL